MKGSLDGSAVKNIGCAMQNISKENTDNSNEISNAYLVLCNLHLLIGKGKVVPYA
jgi:hypothetical protein